ncbi:DUF1830 domain-containing protein [Phormidesmis priestleyi ULC007]|uniref:DUF1830 domain-containing protein n=1 Tax=Phormidesmis priestleyi ULC007 TaxID=1920490 RepID=A0A2T1DP42_9CYAN|nr:DUF1830 domain-containing protein [Phormidesmis priestleyi]PSB22221.1 DUF1830 domain-containing protein [Phormidesmis priestleyi ULC007]PZO52518.1 MAG: DUF1830 domain-containing protein [Phormidesmis priestleyi]
MAQVFDPIPSDNCDRLLCCYVNVTSQIQIARISNIPNWYFERVVFPGQRLLFETCSDAHLEIHTGMMASAILSDTIACSSLRVPEEPEIITPVQEQELERRNEGIAPGNESQVIETRSAAVLTSVD